MGNAKTTTRAPSDGKGGAARGKPDKRVAQAPATNRKARSQPASAQPASAQPASGLGPGMADGLAPSLDASAPDFSWMPIDRVKPWVQNPRKNARAVGKVADSLRAFGWGRPLVVNMWPSCEGELIVGHTAWLAAHELKLEQVPVRLRRMEPAAAHALAIADNKLGEIADWDPDELGRIVGSGEISASQLAIAGFSDAELEALRNPPGVGDTTIEATTECTCPKCGHKWMLHSRAKAAREAA